jgi:hypothetical protein
VTHASWKQAILISAAVAVLAIASVATLAWLRRPPAADAPAARRQPAPLLYYDPSGSVYDLHLKMTQLEERLLVSERHSRRLEEEVGRLQGDREERERQLAELKKRIEEMNRQLALLRRPTDQAPAALGAPTPAAPNAAAGQATEGATEGEGTSPEETTSP